MRGNRARGDVAAEAPTSQLSGISTIGEVWLTAAVNRRKAWKVHSLHQRLAPPASILRRAAHSKPRSPTKRTNGLVFVFAKIADCSPLRPSSNPTASLAATPPAWTTGRRPTAYRPRALGSARLPTDRPERRQARRGVRVDRRWVRHASLWVGGSVREACLTEGLTSELCNCRSDPAAKYTNGGTACHVPHRGVDTVTGPHTVVLRADPSTSRQVRCDWTLAVANHIVRASKRPSDV